MRIKLLFCNIQKWQKHSLSFLIILFMTVSSFGQLDGIDFECVGAGSITFGTPDGTFNGKTSWSNGVDFNGTPGYTLRFEADNTWSVRDPNGPRFFFSNVDVNGLPSCDSLDWQRDLAANGQFCGGVVVTCVPSSDPDNDGDGVPASADCNDNDASISAPITYYVDADGDGFGTTPADFCSSTVPVGYSAVDGDCDDGDTAINPDATEVCDGIDNNCDGNVDEGLTFTTYYVDADGDGFGDEADTGSDLCSDPGAGFSLNNIDCDDSDSTVNPGATETPYNGKDDDCDPATLDDDLDQDGFDIANDCDDNEPLANPGLEEIPFDTIDNDCDGEIDEDDNPPVVYEYCDNQQKKVLICHNGKTKCVSINAVDAHLAHGDYLGSCGNGRELETPAESPKSIDFVSWPNPTNTSINVKMTTPDTITKVSIEAFDINGRLIHANIINGNEDYQFGGNLNAGIYFVKMTQADNSKVLKVIKR